MPVTLKPAQLAAEGAQFSSVVPLAGLERLSAALKEPPETAWCTLTFGLNDAGRPAAWGRIEAQLAFECQRCLETCYLPVTAQTNVEFVDSADAEALATDCEPVVAESGRLELMALIEDELLLALPIAPMHPDSDCGLAARYTDREPPAGRVRPFAGLASMLGQEALAPGDD